MHISSVEQLDEVMSNLHDCPFDLERATSTKARTRGLASFFGRFGMILGPNNRGFSLLYVTQPAHCIRRMAATIFDRRRITNRWVLL